MSPNQPEIPDFEEMLKAALGIRLTKVSHSAIKFTTSNEFPHARVIHRTTVVSVIEKRGHLSNLPKADGSD